MKDYALNQLLKLVSIPSVSSQEGEILFYIEEELTSHGVDYERQRVEGSWFNILVGDVEEPLLVIAAHVDTVAPVDNLPPKPLIENDFIKGLGVCDDKAGVSVMLALAVKYRELLKKKRVLLAFLVDEEKTGLGSEALAKIINAKGALIIEPTNLKICTKEAGSVEFTVITKGKLAHGSCVEEGENAIHKALKIIEGFSKLSFINQVDQATGKSTYSIIQIIGGDGELRIPDKCMFKVDFRLTPKENTERVIGEVINYLNNFKNVEYQIDDISPGFEISECEWIVNLIKKAVKACDMEPLISGMKSWTDAEHFVRSGIPAVIFGPGELSLCHTPEERLHVEEFYKFYEVMESVIDLLDI